MIIALAGRRHSGKSILSQTLLDRGFIKLSFATKLKKLVAELYDWNVEDLYNNNKDEKLSAPVKWTEGIAKQLQQKINTDINLFKEEKTFNKIREALTYIATEILRDTVDIDFHVKSILDQIEPDRNYVIDDLRFQNELKYLKELNATCIFVFRPNYFENYANIASEIGLRRQDFEYVLINNSSKETLVNKFNVFISGLLSKKIKPISRKDLLSFLDEFNYSTKEVATTIKCNRGMVVYWANKYLINIQRNKYKWNTDCFSKPNPEAAYWAGVLSADGCVKNKPNNTLDLTSTDKELVDGFRNFLGTDKKIYVYNNPNKENWKTEYRISTSNPYIIEDMKLWNIEPKKSKYNKIPDCIKNNNELLNYWLVGLIDGDGCIREDDDGNISISFLSSKEITEFMLNIFPSGKSYPKKDCENLFDLRFNGKNAIELYKTIYKGIGLSRKWDKMIKFVSCCC